MTPTGLFFFVAGWVATTTRQRTPSGPTGICGQRSRLRTIWLVFALLELIWRKVQACLNERVIEHTVLFAAGDKREACHIGEDGPGSILPVKPKQGVWL